ncbi:MAG: NCS2 family permease [Abditibacteriota bacterium]|nr:NCS2 family permease [Abditibacteriota bacterium]
MDKFFKLTERNTSVKTEFRAALVTFFAMVYILVVNAGMFSNPLGDGSSPLGVSFGGMYVATALGAIVGSLVMGLLANLPVALASGMGLNAFFVYTICVGMGFSYANALVFILFDGILFIILSATGIRRAVFECIPDCIRRSIVVGIGFMLALLGFKSGGLIVISDATGIAKGSFNVLSGSWSSIMPLLVCLLSVFAVAILDKRKVKGSVFIGMLFGTALYYLLGLTVKDFGGYALFASAQSPLEAFRDFAQTNLGAVFTQGFDFSAYVASHGAASFFLNIICTVFIFLMLDMFDTVGTLYATCQTSGLTDSEGRIENMDKALMSDALATTAGAVFGTNTVTAYAESVTGVGAGGRTGLTAVFVALLFVYALLFAPLGSMVPACASAVALVYVGYIMLRGIARLEWDDPLSVVPAFLTISVTCFACDIALGIAYGMLSYTAMCLFSGNTKKLNAGTWLLTVLFVLMMLVS